MLVTSVMNDGFTFSSAEGEERMVIDDTIMIVGSCFTSSVSSSTFRRLSGVPISCSPPGSASFHSGVIWLNFRVETDRIITSLDIPVLQ